MSDAIFRPCPWCGGQDIKAEYLSDFDCFSVWCLRCKAQGPRASTPTLTQQEMLSNAVLTWNKRVPLITSKE